MAISAVTMLLLVLAIFQDTCANGIRPWNDNTLEPEITDVREDCSNGACLSIFPKKRDEETERVDEKPRQLTKVVASYRITGRPWQISCPCETQYDILDLGLDNYPRYLATARCAVKACHGNVNSCRLIHYKAYILRQRDTSIEGDGLEGQQYVEQIALPESLRTKWQMKPIKVAVACVSNDGKKN